MMWLNISIDSKWLYCHSSTDLCIVFDNVLYLKTIHLHIELLYDTVLHYMLLRAWLSIFVFVFNCCVCVAGL